MTWTMHYASRPQMALEVEYEGGWLLTFAPNLIIKVTYWNIKFHRNYNYRWKHIMMIHFGQGNVLFFGYILYYFGANFLSFHLTFWKTYNMNFWHNTSNVHNSYYLSSDSVFSTNFYVFTHLCLFEWILEIQ